MPITVAMALLAFGGLAVAWILYERAERKHRQAMKTLVEMRREAWADAAKKKRSA